MANTLEIKLVKSVICCPQWMRTVVRTLGLRKINSTARHPDTGATWGQIKRVSHLVSVRKVEE